MFRKMKKKGQTLRHGSGQSTVEYILLATAVIGAMIFFTTSDSSPFKSRLGSTLNTAANSIGGISNRLSRSEEGSNTSIDTPPPDTVHMDPTVGFPTQ